MQNKLEVGMGKGVVTGAPHIISSLGLGSCVVVTVYDSERRIGGLAHIMLPDSNSLNGLRPPYQCADTAIAALLNGLRSRGAVPQAVVAKIAGGARMFPSSVDLSPAIGEHNIISIKHILSEERIPLIGEDTGGHYGRNVEFYLDSGKLVVKAIGREEREI